MHRRARGLKAALIASSLLAMLVLAAPASAATTHTVCASGCDFTTIQAAIDDVGTVGGDTISVQSGTYHEDVTIGKTLTVSGAGAGTTTISGVSGGGSSTVQVGAAGVVIEGFTITRDGNDVAHWNDPLNSAGVAVQGQGNTAEIRNSIFTGNRTGIDINNSNGNSIHNNVIDNNRTGVFFRNQTDNTNLAENQITNNWTVGVLFIDASGGTNSPPQSAANSTFSGNNISGNWYGGIVDRQSGGSVPAPPANGKNFSANWFGTTTPVVTTNATTEPGYSGQIPVAFGGTATPPGGQPDIAGPASANFDYTPLLRSGTDTAATSGFQGDFTQLDVHPAGNQTGTDGRVQEGVNLVAATGTVHVRTGTYVEDVLVGKAVTLQGAGFGPGGSTISGAIGGDSSTVHVTTTGVIVDGFKITREGNNTSDWNNAGLNSAGLAVQGQTAAAEVRNSKFTGNRTGIDINNSNGNSIHNNVIDDNRTGLIFRNQTDNTTFTQNQVTNNWTAGVLFLDASGGTNSPVQSAANSDFSGNNISGNWYGGIVDRQSGGSIPAPPTNPKNFSANWFGVQAPVVTTNPTTEPGYAGQIPVEFGGAATPPGGQPDIAGPASGNFDYTPLLRTGTDTAPATLGFQGDFSDLTVTAAGAQTGGTGRIEEGVNRTTVGGTVRALAGTYSETDTISKHVHLIGAGNSTVVDPPANGPAIAVAASGTQPDPLTISSLKITGTGGSGNTGSGLNITSTVSDVTVSHVRSTGNGGSGLAMSAAGSITRLRLDAVDFSSNGLDGLRFPTSMTGLDGLSVVNSHFDLNGFAGMELYGPPSTGAVTNLTFTDSSFDRNDTKGIYAERMSNATFDGISVHESGTLPGTNTFTAGIDLNLKKQAFTNITIQNSSITGSGTGDPVNGVGVTIKSRDDGTNGPTSVAGVTVTHNQITGNQLGLRLGEPGKNNAGPTNVHVNRNNISGNVGGNGMTNVSTVAADASCNWWGAANGPGGSGPGTGNSVSTLINFTPWLVSSDLDGSCVAPTAVADSGSTPEDTQLTVAAPGLLGNDTNPENRTLTASKVTDPAHGTVTVNANGSYTYVPNGNYNGPDSFTYKANDGTRDSNTVTVSLTVTPVNDPPVANNDAGSVNEDGTLNVAAPGVLSNDTDTESQPLTAVKVSDPAHGSLTLNANGSYSYTPAANFNGTDSFTYRATDGTDSSTLVATVTITVNPVNDAPVAVNDTATVPEDGTLTKSATTGVLSNDSDADGDSLTAIKVSEPAHGTVTLNSNGSYEYTPAANYNGPDSFTYTASDGTISSSTATVNITVTPVNDAPVAVNDTGTVNEDGVLNVAAADGVLKNDTDTESQPLTAVKVSDPAHGSVTLNANGSYSYTPNANYNGPDSFTYKANDGTADSNVATVSLAVNPVSDAPVAVDDSASVNENGTLSGAAPGVLGNDTDADGQALTAVKVSDPGHGTLTLNSNGSYEYAPAANYSGPDSFTYKANDGTADSNVATVSITVKLVPPGGPGEDITAPVFVSLSLTNTTFRVDPAGAAETLVAARAKKGTTFVYSLSESARVLFTIESRTTGRKVGTQCRKLSRSNRTRPRCTRFVTVGRFGQDGAAGANRKKFSGKIGAKALTPGRYRATLRATDAAGNRSVLKRLSFTVVSR